MATDVLMPKLSDTMEEGKILTRRMPILMMAN